MYTSVVTVVIGAGRPEVLRKPGRGRGARPDVLRKPGRGRGATVFFRGGAGRGNVFEL